MNTRIITRYCLLCFALISLIPYALFASSVKGWGNMAVDSEKLTGSLTAIAAGQNHSLALRSDGIIVGWGSNVSGQAIPPEGNDFIAITAGDTHSLALKSDGSIITWGYSSVVPSPNTDFVAIAASGAHSLGLKSDSSIVAWGRNDYGECNVPSPNTDFVAIAAGGTHSLGLKSDGSIVAWGNNSSGECNVPAPNTDFVAIAAGCWHSLGLKSDGTIVGWGMNVYGQATPPAGNSYVAIAAGCRHSLALNSNGSIVGWGYNSGGMATPPAGNNFVAIAAGESHSLALKSDGTIVGWGDNSHGQTKPPVGDDFVATTVGFEYSLALKSNGSIFGWGNNSYGRATPPDGNNFVAVAAGWGHSLAVTSDGSIVGWGNNSSGQVTPPDGNNFVAIAAGGSHSLGLKSDGSITAWGINVSGECNIPSPNTGFVAIAAGNSHSLALKSDGSIIAWGSNSSGQCDVPPPNTDFVAIAAGHSHSLGLKADGTIVGWGSDAFGEATPPDGNDYVAIAAGDWYSLALMFDGTVVGWGRNEYIQATPPDGNDFSAIAAGHTHSLALQGGILPLAFKIQYIRPTHAGNLGPAIIEVIGSGFKEGVTVRLIQGTTELEPNEVTLFSLWKLRTRFDLNEAPLGKYDIVVTNPGGNSIALPQGFEVVEGGQPQLSTSLIVRPQLRFGRHYTAYIEYGNEGDVAMPIPVFHIDNSEDTLMQIGRYGRQSNLGLALLGLGQEGFRTTLLPGYKNTIPITFIAPNTDSIEFSLATYIPDSNAFPWDALESIVRPSHLTDEVWDPEWDSLISNMGSTWQEVIDNLAPVLSEIPEIDVEISSDLVGLLTIALWIYDQPTRASELYDIRGGFDPPSDVNIVYDDFDPSRTCNYIITHGASNSAADMRNLANKIAAHCPSCNVLRVDWEKGADHYLPWPAADNIEEAGQEAFTQLDELLDPDDWEHVTFIGHSFGNNVNHVISGAAGRVGSAIVLDPANYIGSIGSGSTPYFSDTYPGDSLAVITDSLGDNGPCWPPGSDQRIADWQLYLPSSIGREGHGEALRCLTEQIPTEPSCDNPWLTGTLYQSVSQSPPGWYDGEINCEGELVGGAFQPCPEPNDMPIPQNILNWAISTIISALDPSEKRGTEGYDPCGTPLELCQHFVRPGEPLVYTVFFENEPNATAPAQEVRVIDYLSPSLDWTTVELGEITFGDQVVATLAGKVSGQDIVPLENTPYVVDINAQFNPYTGCLNWTLRTIDPYTGDFPEDPLAGFLPPNDANHRGEGHVTFNVSPQQGLLDARIFNNATIIFDVEPPFDANAWLNVIDGFPPTSAVLPLPPLTIPKCFEVQWTGDDDQGCGIAGYDIYVATQDGPYELWLSDTNDTSSFFVGVPGYPYRFYSISRDFLGNAEVPPLVPDAETTTSAINLHFYAKFASYWLESNCQPPEWCEGMDFNMSQVIDLDDLALLATGWLLDCSLDPNNPSCASR